MARYTETASRVGNTGRRRNTQQSGRQGNTEYPISVMQFEIGETKRVVIPKFKFEDGGEFPLIVGEPTHKVLAQGFLQKISKQGKPYNLFEVRCMNPKRQVGENRKKFAEEKCHCAFCQLARLENRRTKQLIHKAYEEKILEDASNDEMRAFYQKVEGKNKIQASYVTRKNNAGRTTAQRYIVGLEIETQTITDTTGKVPKKKVIPVADENGLPKYKIVYIKAPDTMLSELQTEASNAFDAELLSDDLNFGYEGEVEDENGQVEYVQYPFVDFQFQYPNEKTRQESALNRKIRATIGTQSVITPEFVEAIQARSEEIIKLAEENLYRAVSTLAPFSTIEEQLSLMADGGEYYREMVKTYGITDENRAEPEEIEGKEGIYAVQLTDAEWEEIAFKQVLQDKYNNSFELEMKKKVLADKGIEGEPNMYTPEETTTSDKSEEKQEETEKETTEKPKTAKKVAKKATKTETSEAEDLDGFFAEN